MIIAVDFDGTLCEDVFPEIGVPNIYLIEMLKFHQKQGDKLILWTCRCGKYLDKAVEWCKDQGLIFDAVNKNVPDVIAKYGESGPKVFADLYIDDRAQGADNCSTALVRINHIYEEIKKIVEEKGVYNMKPNTKHTTKSISLEQRSSFDGVNGRYYLELPDGYRLIYDNDGYVGRYDPNLNEVI